MSQSPLFNYLRYATIVSYFFSSVSAVVFMVLAIIRATFEAAYIYDVSGSFYVPNLFLLALEVGTPIFSVMFDAVVILGIQLMLNRIYIMNVIKSSLVILLMASIFALVSSSKLNPFDKETQFPFILSGSLAMLFNGVALVISLWMRNLERKMYG
ncbi:hypothetical protein MetMK1DRAFT_00009010 [Metallosphaera yellowstonensis MK1]|jgi:hypothetical protein|uniref:Uncharacterized protein n=1 Tax=Metallosphaera yellowstonensis MK1 TaxID=671065 RepID=H2C2C8_9CREN|nr:hypothetical protein [Metallosphaera yellowstonensis]EHP70399.1 hypothetical protein MetMK1DRAFT_00009010 [Metallosphaera yellowstonensis MK1]